MLNKFYIISLVFTLLIAHSASIAQQELNNVNIILQRVKKNKVIVKITNDKDSSIYVMSKPITGQGAFQFITSCDSLNSKSYNYPVTLPPDFYRKSNMVEIKPKKTKRIGLKTSTKWFSISACKTNQSAFAYLKIYIYDFSSIKLNIVDGFILLKKPFKII